MGNNLFLSGDFNFLRRATPFCSRDTDAGLPFAHAYDNNASCEFREGAGIKIETLQNDVLDLHQGLYRSQPWAANRAAYLAPATYASLAALCTQAQTAIGAAGISPLALQPSAWYRGEDLIPYYKDGQYVAYWPDASGNGRHATQTTAARRPIFKEAFVNGRPAVEFDGDDACLVTGQTCYTLLGGGATAAAPARVGGTVVTVLYDTEAGATTRHAWCDATNDHYHQARTSGPVLRALLRDPAAQYADTALSINAWHVGLWMANADLISVGVDDLDTAALVTDTYTSATLDTMAGSLYIGNYTGTSWKGYIAEIIFFDHALTEEARRRLVAYLAQKYAIAAHGTTAPSWKDLNLGAYYNAGAAGGTITAHFVADDMRATLADGAAVPSWTDRSGNARHAVQATAGYQPLYIRGSGPNGHDCIRFDGTNDGLTLPGTFATYLAGGAGTVFAVVRQNVAATLHYLLRTSGVVTTGHTLFLDNYDTGAGHIHSRARAGLYDGAEQFASVDLGDDYRNTWVLLALDIKATPYLVGGNDLDDAAMGNAAYGPLTNTDQTIHIGCEGVASTWFGDIAELVILRASAGETLRQRMAEALRTKYGIAATGTTVPSAEAITVTAATGEYVAVTATNATHNIPAYSGANGPWTGWGALGFSPTTDKAATNPHYSQYCKLIDIRSGNLDVIRDSYGNGGAECGGTEGWTASGFTASTVDKYSGGWSFTWSTVGAYLYRTIGPANYPSSLLKAGDAFRLSFYQKESAGALSVYVLDWHTGKYLQADGSWASAAYATPITAAAAWAQASVTGVFESAQARGRSDVGLLVQFTSTGATAAGYIDKIELVPGYNFVSIHGHNVPPASSYGSASYLWTSDDWWDTQTAQLTLAPGQPAFYGKNSTTLYSKHFRVTITLPSYHQENINEVLRLYAGEIVVGYAKALSSALKWDFGVAYDPHHITVRSEAGRIRRTRVADQTPRILKGSFKATTAVEEAELRQELYGGCHDGELPIVIVPIDTEPMVLFGYLVPEREVRRRFLGAWNVDVVVEEDGFPTVGL